MTTKKITKTEIIKQYKDLNDLDLIKSKLALNHNIFISKDYIRMVLYRINNPTEKKIRAKKEIKINENEIKDKAIILNIKEKDNKLFLNIKTTKEYEQFLKDNKELSDEVSNYLFGTSGDIYPKLRFYKGTITGSFDNDNINRPLIIENRNTLTINKAVLRLEGISEGLSFEILTYYPINELQKMLNRFIESYYYFYEKIILNKKIDLSGEVWIK